MVSYFEIILLFLIIWSLCRKQNFEKFVCDQQNTFGSVYPSLFLVTLECVHFDKLAWTLLNPLAPSIRLPIGLT